MDAIDTKDIDISKYPAELHSILSGAALHNSSGHSGAKTLFIDKDNGYFLKSAQKGALENEAVMMNYFHGKGLSTNVLAYISDERDWLLTEKISGDDGTAAKYLEQPERLCDIFAERLAMLHSLDFSDCPVKNHTERILSTAKQNYHAGTYDKSHFPDSWGYASAEAAFQMLESRGHLLQTDTLLHGDYCLPNIILDDWTFGGFIDLGNGGIGDRHVDLFWAMWTLNWNLHTDAYRERFIDAYGRNKVNEECLRIIAAVEVFGE